MSVPPSSPYKSRIFNAINRTFLALNDHNKINLNKLKIFAKWGLQILIYPIYLGIQTARIAINQILNPTQNQNSSLPPEIKQPIEQILTEIQPQLSTEIKGIATELEAKNLVLITNNNQILHLKNKIQEQQLEKWIKWELANYYYQQKLLAKNYDHSPELKSIKTDNPHLILPVQLFWKMMSWVEKSPLAISLNLFGELKFSQDQPTQNFQYLPQNQEQKSENLNSNLTLLSTIDQKIAILENNQNITTLINSTEELTEKLTEFIKERLIKLNLINESDDPFTVKAIIMAAINYFFGQGNHLSKITSETENSSNHQTLILETNDNFQQKILTSKGFETNIIQEKIDDPWLSSSNFFTNTVTSNFNYDQNPENQSLNYQLNGFHLIPEKPKISALEKIKQLLNIESKISQSQSLIIPQTNPTLTENLMIVNDNIIANQEIIKIEHLTNSLVKNEPILSTNQEEITEFFVETKATHLGYEKHFLEHLLNWLDSLILLLEEILINIFKWLKRKF